MRVLALCAHNLCLSMLYARGIPAPMARGPRCDVARMHPIVRCQKTLNLPHDRLAFLSSQSFKFCSPGASLDKVWKFRGLSPSPRRVCRCATSPQQVHVHFPICFGGFRAFRLCLVMQCPVACIKIIDASILQLRQDIQHGFACGCH